MSTADIKSLKKDVEQLVTQEKSLEDWIGSNYEHCDFEKVNRQLNIVRAKLLARNQKIERLRCPGKYSNIGDETLIKGIAL